jgi:hypothetical protein
MAEYKSVKVSAVTYNEIDELQQILLKRGTDVLPKGHRPAKASFDGIVQTAIRALRKRVR